MLRVVDIVKRYHTPIGERTILDGISFDIGVGEKIGVLGRNGSGKSTLMKILGGVEIPSAGSVERGLFMSWPLAFSGGIESNMTGISNARFIARLYGKCEEDVIAFVDDFAELGRQLYVAVRDYSSGMRMKLAFALTLAIEFECFLIDEVIAVGDHKFHRKCYDALFVERSHSAMVLISHDTEIMRRFCAKALVLKGGRSYLTNDIDLAIDIYRTL
ncbi:ATP-binding cassette domain-containing protein [Rhizobiales bacterium Sp-1]|uniref:ATP-binding cassette domain-containing protein n=2 Tax=Segnochrobactrum spirostomi TaxID=2608987 RepID=A0A6A7Y959_9HYPH|nr:ATP-binding cassette domain-containing protein [Segnochrobactrum spirostomi]